MMVTVQSRGVADGSEEPDETTARARQCVYCGQLIVWMRTYLDGRTLCFDSEPVPRELDDGTGWAPGMFTIRRRSRTVLAPLFLHPSQKREQVSRVMHTHRCRGYREKVQVA